MILLPKNNATINRRIEAPVIVQRSIAVIPFICKGVIVELQPKTKKILKILLPTTFPIAISGFFLSEATTEVANSGNEDRKSVV